MTPKLVDIARETKTSVSTVSRVFAGGHAALRISADTRERVAAAATRLGYRPNLLARSLRTRKSYLIALVLPDISRSWFSSVALRVEQLLHQQGYSLMLCNSGEDEARELQYLDMLPRRSVDGLIVVPQSNTPGQWSDLTSSAGPIVVLDRMVKQLPCVYSDIRAGVEQLGKTLNQAGVRKIILITPSSNENIHHERCQLIESHLEVVKKIEIKLDPSAKKQLAAETRGVTADAIVCTGPCGAELYLASQQQLDPARPIAVFDGSNALMSIPTPIVSCDHNARDMATAVVQLLLPQINGDSPEALQIAVPMTLRSNPLMIHRS